MSRFDHIRQVGESKTAEVLEDRQDDDVDFWPGDNDTAEPLAGIFVRKVKRASARGGTFGLLIVEDEDGDRYGVVESAAVARALEDKELVSGQTGLYFVYHGLRSFNTMDGEPRTYREITTVVVEPEPTSVEDLEDDDDEDDLF